MIFAITGTGRTATGVLKVLSCMPIKTVPPERLPELVKDVDNPDHARFIYVSTIKT